MFSANINNCKAYKKFGLFEPMVENLPVVRKSSWYLSKFFAPFLGGVLAEKFAKKTEIFIFFVFFNMKA